MTTLDDPYPRLYLSQPISHSDSVNTPTTSPSYLKYLMPEEEIRWAWQWVELREYSHGLKAFNKIHCERSKANSTLE